MKQCRIGQIAKAIMSLNSANACLQLFQFDSKKLETLGVCIESECAHWVEDYPEVKREWHSGGLERLRDEGLRTKRTSYQESYDLWVLLAKGHCGFVNPAMNLYKNGMQTAFLVRSKHGAEKCSFR